MAEPGSPLLVDRVILESESEVLSESECSDIVSSPVDSDPLILSCVTPDYIQSTPITSQLSLSKPHLSQRYVANNIYAYNIYNIYTDSVINLENLEIEKRI